MSTETKTYVTPEELRALGFMQLERARQVDEEKYTNEDDDAHQDGSLWQAAFFYATTALKPPVWPFMYFKKWPWSPEFFKPWKKDASGNYTTEIDKERCLVKAGALILAEQERLARAMEKVVAKLAEIQTQKTNE